MSSEVNARTPLSRLSLALQAAAPPAVREGTIGDSGGLHLECPPFQDHVDKEKGGPGRNERGEGSRVEPLMLSRLHLRASEFPLCLLLCKLSGRRWLWGASQVAGGARRSAGPTSSPCRPPPSPTPGAPESPERTGEPRGRQREPRARCGRSP